MFSVDRAGLLFEGHIYPDKVFSLNKIMKGFIIQSKKIDAHPPKKNLCVKPHYIMYVYKA